ncbi:MAG: aspartyl/asparaginyl beta-hydroxylase domain-containing protein [Pseudanabaenaceae cyanobacterium SKYGB_i_bin29]|nr:aspartyl/asparaginyl beta-hydroxylase domain-containing protein [Pseudanabaenaceae cyanobacterium SKYG29]MDW8422048.1 aspartyl/asparaginyl beta-hydroxylase domain-containing protein [Pseudanabaenaceae cyanobacterium SKYGB_i_bin29]
MLKDKRDFPFTTDLEANWQIIRDEALAVKQERFLAWPERHLYQEGWAVFGLIAFGVEIAGNTQLCPQTTALVREIPGLVTAGFSALRPGTHIAPHTGYADGVLRCHLGLVGCAGCSIRVGEEIRTWQEGKCLVFDDTTEHEVWHRGQETRIVLLLDFRYPYYPQTTKNWWGRWFDGKKSQ